MSKILFIVPRFHTNLVPIVKKLCECNEVHFIVSYVGDNEDHDQLRPFVIKPIVKATKIKKEVNFSDTWPQPYSLYKQLRDVKPDIVFLRALNKHTIVSLLMCKMLGIKRIIFYDQTPIYFLNQTSLLRLKRDLKRLCLSILNVHFRVSPVLTKKYYNKKKLNTLIKDKKSYFLNFTAGPKIDLPMPKNLSKYRILIVGKFRDYKNPKLILKTLSKIKNKSLINIHFVGQRTKPHEIQYVDEMKKYIIANSLEKHITFSFNVKYNEMSKLYAEHDILILPSKNEAASVSIIEAMANSVLIISTNQNGTASYIEDGVTGLIFESGNAYDLASKIEYITSDINLYNKMRTNASLEYNNQYCDDTYYSTLREIIKKEFDFYV